MNVNLEAASNFLDILLMLIVYLVIIVVILTRIIELYKSKIVFYWDYQRIQESFIKILKNSNNKELEEEVNLFFASGRKKIILDRDEFEKIRAEVIELYEKIKLETKLTCEVSEFLISQMYGQKSSKNYLQISNHKLSKNEKKLLNSIFVTSSNEMTKN